MKIKKAWFLCDCFRNIEVVSKRCRILNSFIIEKKLKFKTSKLYFDDIQKFFDKWIKEYANEFDFKSNIYQFDRTKILFVSDYLIETVFNDWHRHKKTVDTTVYTWKIFVFFLQKHLKSLHMRFAKIDQKLKHAKSKFNQSIDELITHIEKLKTQLSELFIKYQKYFNFLHTLQLHFRKTMLRNYFDIFFRRELKKLTRKFEHIEILFDERKTRDFDSNRIRKKRFFYRQSNVDNVNENDDVQSAISRNESKNKKEWREYRERRSQKNEISHEKINEFKNKNFINFFKMKCHRCHKNEHYVRNCVEFELIKESSKKK